MDKKRLYYVSQFGGWSFFLLVSTVMAIAMGQSMTWDSLVNLFLILVIGIGTTHLYRFVIIQLDWLNLNMTRLIPRILLSTVIYALFFGAVHEVLIIVVLGKQFVLQKAISDLMIWASLLFIWSLIYFAFHFFQNYRKQEIKNLQWEASSQEFELNRLKSQLNPHFIFNSMNTIRALVDEDPDKAKRSITQLANVLRTSLMTGKRKVISLEEELNLVRDYLEIESARYEERLSVEWDIDSEALDSRVPPLMLQTLVENGIKHGISTLPKGGTVTIAARVEKDMLVLEITNSGKFVEKAPTESGFGIYNTRQRLSLLYGSEGSFDIQNVPKGVRTTVRFPAILKF